MVRYPPLRVIQVLLVALLMCAAPLAVQAEMGHNHQSGPVKLQKPKGTACVLPEEQMRRTHMDYLKHKRAVTVREGVRVRDESLKNCISCHPSKKKFCEQCHKYVGVKPDCFECHNYPD
ncbi:MAG: Hdr-like menaquinol oxidoreductase cytochrome c subunit [Magnetococcales bacterium]|nr:Hdr-like menaquinol oxidoreductase cytochrome c subunit [Magnetococcales bacterium]